MKLLSSEENMFVPCHAEIREISQANRFSSSKAGALDATKEARRTDGPRSLQHTAALEPLLILCGCAKKQNKTATHNSGLGNVLSC